MLATQNTLEGRARGPQQVAIEVVTVSVPTSLSALSTVFAAVGKPTRLLSTSAAEGIEIASVQTGLPTGYTNLCRNDQDHVLELLLLL